MPRPKRNKFRKFFIYNAETNESKCNVENGLLMCNKIIKGDHGTNLTQHIKRCHPLVYDNEINEHGLHALQEPILHRRDGNLQALEPFLFEQLDTCQVKSESQKLESMFNGVQTPTATKRIKLVVRRRRDNHANEQTLRRTYERDLWSFMLDTSTPLSRLDDGSMSKFLRKYAKVDVPSAESLTGKFLLHAYQDRLRHFQEIVRDKYIWISLNECMDRRDRYYVNCVFGLLEGSAEQRSECYLLNLANLEQVNSSSIAGFFTTSLQLLWPNGILYERVMLVITKAISHMTLGFEALQTLFPKMLHLHCFAECFQRVSEYVRADNVRVDALIKTTCEVFKSQPSYCQLLKRLYPDMALPRMPCASQYGTWLHAVDYFCNNFAALESLVSQLDSFELESVQMAKNLFADTHIRDDLSYVQCCFKCLSDALDNLTKSNAVPLKHSIDSVLYIHEIFQNFTDKKYLGRLRSIFDGNRGFKMLKHIYVMLYNSIETENVEAYIENLTTEELYTFENCPVTSHSMEKTFPMYESILNDSSIDGSFEQLKMWLIVKCNHSM